MSIDIGKIGSIAMDLHDELVEHLPEGCKIVAVGLCAEVEVPCENGGTPHTHSIVIPAATPDSDIHKTALFEEASENVGAQWHIEVED